MSSLSVARVQFETALINALAGLSSSAAIGVGSSTIPDRVNAINYVKAKLDEIIPEGEGISISLSSSANVSNPLSLLINAHLDECTKNVILSAPLHLLTPTSLSRKSYKIDDQTGYIVLPEDFLRLSSFKMSEWLKEVTVPITPKHPDYKKQSTVLRGGISKPVAVLNWRNMVMASPIAPALALGAAGNLSNGVYLYKISYVNPVGESALSSSATITVEDNTVAGQVDLTLSKSSDATVTARKIYRTAAGGSVCKLVATINDNTTTTYSDNIADANLGSSLQEVASHGSKKILEYYSVLKDHVVEKLLYLPEMYAQDFLTVNPNLMDALAWMTASKIFQITGLLEQAKLAQDRVTQSFL